jgi:hypothetical protein
VTTIAAPLSHDAPIADILSSAAAYAAAFDSADTRTLVADAIGAALGHHTPGDVDFHVIPAIVGPHDWPPHAAFAAVMSRLGSSIQDVFWWSSIHTAGQVAAMLRDAAAAVTCVSCGAPWGQPHAPNCQFTLAAEAVTS